MVSPPAPIALIVTNLSLNVVPGPARAFGLWRAYFPPEEGQVVCSDYGLVPAFGLDLRRGYEASFPPNQVNDSNKGSNGPAGSRSGKLHSEERGGLSVTGRSPATQSPVKTFLV